MQSRVAVAELTISCCGEAMRWLHGGCNYSFLLLVTTRMLEKREGWKTVMVLGADSPKEQEEEGMSMRCLFTIGGSRE